MEIETLLIKPEIVDILKDSLYLVLNSGARPQPSSILSTVCFYHNCHNSYAK